MSSGGTVTNIPRAVKQFQQILRLLAVIACVSGCRVPKAIVVQEPSQRNIPANLRTTAENGTASTTELPGKTKGRNEDAPRTPDMLNQLPEERDFQPTNPSAAHNAYTDGAVVAKPPSSTPPHDNPPKNPPQP